jgi:hypothetical protein
VQLWNYLVDEVFEAFWHVGEHDVEPSQPPRKAIAPFHRRWSQAADEGEPAEAAGDLGELSHR